MTTSNASPRKASSRIDLRTASIDPAGVRLPESPEKRTLRSAKSHSHLSSTASSRLAAKPPPPLPSLASSLLSRDHASGTTTTATTSATATATATASTAATANTTATQDPPPRPPMPQHTSLTTRQRANSDALALSSDRQQRGFRNKPGTTTTGSSGGLGFPSGPLHSRKSSVEVTFRDGPRAGTSASASLATLRTSILTSGVAATKEGMSDYRVYLWLALLNLAPLPTDEYLQLIHRGRSPAHSKIANDVFRTLATDALFKRRVTDASLTRLLNATAWRIHLAQQSAAAESAEGGDGQSAPAAPAAPVLRQEPYLQGINVLSAPLLYASRSETQAYALLNNLLSSHIPSYITPTMSGVHRGLDLIDRILALREPNLSAFLLEKVGPAKVYAFASVLTLSACTPPLPEVLKLWDFLFAFGVHLNIVCVVAQLVLMKQKLYDSPSPTKLLRSFPHLDAKGVIALTLVIVRDLPEHVYAELVLHGKAAT